jgi:Flp pilus assembly protein TadD
VIPLQRVMFPTRRLSGLLLAGVAALALSACATNRTTTSARSPDFSGQTSEQAQTTLSELGARYKKSPKDKTTIIYYSAALRANGQNEQAVAVVERGMSAFGRDTDMRVAYAKALSAAGRFPQALQVLDDTIDPASPDWNALSVKGAILDQMGRNAEARQLYSRRWHGAGRSRHLCQSRPLLCDDQRPQTRRRQPAPRRQPAQRHEQGAAEPGARRRPAGRFDESRKLFAAELPPEQVESNMNYIRALLTQQNRWDAIKGDQG